MLNSTNGPSRDAPGDLRGAHIGPGTPGRAALSAIASLENLHELISIGGALSAPHSDNGHVLRCEIRPAALANSGFIRFILRIDAAELGRVLYAGGWPKTGEPSYRELGAVAMDALLILAAETAKQDVGNLSPEFQNQALSVAQCGLRFVGQDRLLGVDSRYATIEFSWAIERSDLKDAQHPLAINWLIEKLQEKNKIAALKAQARLKFTPHLALFYESLVGFSETEKKSCTLPLVDIERLVKLGTRPDIADRNPIEREPTGRSCCELTPVDRERFYPPTAPDAIGSSFVYAPRLESIDVTRFREALKNNNFRVSADPLDFEIRNVAHLVESEKTLHVYLELQQEVCGVELANDIFPKHPAADELGKALDYEHVRLVKTNKLRNFISINIKLPEFDNNTRAIRSHILGKTFKLILAHKNDFVLNSGQH